MSSACTGSSCVKHKNTDLHFASFLAQNAAALHLLESVQATDSPISLKPINVLDAEPNGIPDGETLAYILSVPSDVKDSNRDIGKWRFGAGPSSRLKEKTSACCPVDCLLCPPGTSLGAKRARQSIGGVHAVLFFHPESGVLILRNIRSKPIIYRNGHVTGGDLELNVEGNASCVLFRKRNYLIFGEYEFVLAFHLEPGQYEKFRAQRDLLISLNNDDAYGSHTRPSQHLALVPIPEHYTNGPVRIHRKLWEGSHSNVYCGVHLHTGRPVAVKKMRYAEKTVSWVQDEVQIADLFKGSCEYVLGTLDKWRPILHGTACEAPEHPEYYSLPLAEYNFETMPWRRLGFEVRLRYLYQTLVGLCKLHEKNITHGRIRPRCLMILPGPGAAAGASKLDSPFGLPTKAAISPSVCTHSSNTTSSGYWVAPEVWTSTDGHPCTQEADTWGLGASWLRCFTIPPENIKIDRKTYATLIQTLKARKASGNISELFFDLIVRMLAWDPKDRPCVEEALAHAVWEPVRIAQKKRFKRDKQDRMRKPDNRVKRVRILSPDPE